MAAAGGSEKESWGRRARDWGVVVLVVAVLGAMKGGVGIPDGDSDAEPQPPPPPSLGDRATSDVTCREVNEDVETLWALSVRVLEELKLPSRVNTEVATMEAEEALDDVCFEGDPNERPVDSDFKGSLKAKLVHRSKR